jgi:hypothetical protein
MKRLNITNIHFSSLLNELIFWFAHSFSDKLFNKRHNFTENDPSGASTPTKGTRNLYLCALVYMMIFSAKYIEPQNFILNVLIFI